MKVPVIIKTSGEQVKYLPQNGTDFKLEECQQAVGGYIEVLGLNGGLIMVCNENGAFECAPNYAATLVFAMTYGNTDAIMFGDVIVCPSDMLRQKSCSSDIRC